MLFPEASVQVKREEIREDIAAAIGISTSVHPKLVRVLDHRGAHSLTGHVIAGLDVDLRTLLPLERLQVQKYHLVHNFEPAC